MTIFCGCELTCPMLKQQHTHCPKNGGRAVFWARTPYFLVVVSPPSKVVKASALKARKNRLESPNTRAVLQFLLAQKYSQMGIGSIVM